MKMTTKVFFYALFVPYLLLILFGVISSFSGICIGFFGDQSLDYGTDAFSAVFVFGLIGCWYLWLLCLIIQIVLLVKEKADNKGTVKKCVLHMILVYFVSPILGFGLSFLGV